MTPMNQALLSDSLITLIGIAFTFICCVTGACLLAIKAWSMIILSVRDHASTLPPAIIKLIE